MPPRHRRPLPPQQPGYYPFPLSTKPPSRGISACETLHKTPPVRVLFPKDPSEPLPSSLPKASPKPLPSPKSLSAGCAPAGLAAITASSEPLNMHSGASVGITTPAADAASPPCTCCPRPPLPRPPSMTPSKALLRNQPLPILCFINTAAAAVAAVSAVLRSASLRTTSSALSTSSNVGRCRGSSSTQARPSATYEGGTAAAGPQVTT